MHIPAFRFQLPIIFHCINVDGNMEIRLHTARPLIKHKYPLYLNCIAQNKLQLSQVPVCKPPKNIFLKKHTNQS